MATSGRSAGRPPTHRRVRSGAGTKAALLLLVQLAVLLPTPPAAAQAPTPDVCFTMDSDGDSDTPEDSVLRCTAGLPDGAHYMQGDLIDLTLRNVTTSALVRVTCLTSCHETAGKAYYARYNVGDTLRFPRDFRDPLGANAVADRAPRYNSSWEAAVLLTQSSAPIARGTFNVWLLDRFTSSNMTVMPGERHVLRAAGFDAGAVVRMVIERRAANGSWVQVHAPTGQLLKNSQAGFDNHVFSPNHWEIPKTEARGIAECGSDLDGCYRIVVKGAGKDDEVVPFRVAPARLQLEPFASVGNAIDGGFDATPPAAQRTSEAFVAVDLRYPGGTGRRVGERMTDRDATVSPFSQEPVLRARIERVNVTATTPVQDLPLTFRATQQRWEGRWTIPKDFPLGSSEPDAHYRIRLLPDRDAYGNRIPEIVLANYTIARAVLAPTLRHDLTTLGRTEDGNVSFEVRYHNGTPVGPSDLAAPLRGCFVRESQGEPINCAGVDKTVGVHEDGRWVFKVKFPRTYAHLEKHKFHLMSDGVDKWGNQVAAAVAGPFDVTAGSPRVELTTVLRGVAKQELERGGGSGNHVSVQARIRYADGAPFNRDVNVNNSAQLVATLVKRGPDGAIAAQEPLTLREADGANGLWIGDLTLTADDARTPLGTWTFRLDVRDNLTVPNANRTSFDRTVVAVPLVLEPVRQPHGLIETGATQTFRFRVLYGDGAPVPHASLVEGLSVHLHRYDPRAQATFGEPVAPRLVPAYDEATGWYGVELRVPTNLFSGTYAFVVTGGDRHGNLLREARSREFSTTSKTVERTILAQPPPEIMRGESATVVFDAREGDVGLAGTGRPAIHVERFDASVGDWVRERSDALQASPDLQDHVGLFAATLTTPGGLYRFVYEGRDASLQTVRSVSANFSILPAEVPRLILLPPSERMVKGGSVTFTIERRDGDRITDVQVLYNGRLSPVVDGRPLSLPVPVLSPAGPNVNVTWEAPFDAPTGNYTFRVHGVDLYGNRIEVLTPSVEAQVAQLAGRILGQPSRSVARGEAITLLFGITYPSGAYYVAPEPPVVNVIDEAGAQARAQVAPQGLTYVATWVPGPSAPLGEHRFEVSGTGVGGNAFPNLRSNVFRVLPGVVTRPPIADVPSVIERMDTGVFSVAVDPRDKRVEFTLSYYGPAADASGIVFETEEPRTRATLAHTLEASTGRYVAKFVTDQLTPPGVYRITMTGEDGHGNRLQGRSSPFTLRPTNLVVVPDNFPPDDAFGEGKTIAVGFVVRYRSGLVMDESHGTPSVVMLFTAPGRAPRPVTDRPEVEFRNGRWHASWTAPDVLPEGVYEFSIGGFDDAGNSVASVKSRAYVVTTTVGESAAKLLPAPGAAHAVLVLAGVAAAVALATGRRRRDD